MGSSSKKVKGSKESRKRRHRSRSISDEEIREKERHRHRKHHHRERRHERKEKHREYESEDSPERSPQSKQIHTIDSSPEHSPPPQNDQRSAESLSIDETNKLRAKLGLKPLEVTAKEIKNDDNKSDNKIKDDLGEFYHKPAISLKEKAQQEKLRVRLAEKKEKRKLEGKLNKIKTLGESDSEDDVNNWVEKNRKIQKEKEQAAKRAKALEELDEEFGVGDIIESETRLKRAKIYSAKNLRGLKVEHNVENFDEGKSVILTLKDSDVLDENGDVLVNVNMIDDERYKKSNENKKKRPGYQPFEDEFDEQGNFQEKSLLGKYDEEIDGEQRDSFVIGQENAILKKRLAESVKEKLSNKRLESLTLPQLNIASDYYTEEELVKFKKPKRKIKKIRGKPKVLTAAELAASLKEDDLNKDLGSRKAPRITEETPVPGSSKGEMTHWMEVDDIPEPKSILEDIKLEPEDTTLELALRKARRLKQKQNLTSLPPVTSLIKEEVVDDSGNVDSGNIILNSTAEFCRTLGDIPTYGRSGNRDEEKDLVDFERELKEEVSAESPQSSPRMNSWNPVDPMEVVDSLTVHPEAPILDEEPDVGKGVGNALKLALSKGYLDKEENNRPSTSRFAHLQAKHYSIEDKTYGDDDGKFGGRRERHNGPTQDFKEKDTFKPNVKLEYIDDDGRVLNAKEAFRYLSHKFHGKGPGKNKIEKRLKKSDQEVLMKKMSSTDTPLGTLNMLQHKQKEMQSPFIVLSGSKHTHSTSISKTRR